MEKEKETNKAGNYLNNKVPLASASRRVMIPTGGSTKDKNVASLPISCLA